MKDQPAPENPSAAITADESRLLEQLRANPIVATRLSGIMERFEREVEAGMDAHEAEMMIIEEIQQLGHSLLDQWADQTHDATLSAACEDDPALIKHGKKNSTGIRPSEPSS